MKQGRNSRRDEATRRSRKPAAAPDGDAYATPRVKGTGGGRRVNGAPGAGAGPDSAAPGRGRRRRRRRPACGECRRPSPRAERAPRRWLGRSAGQPSARPLWRRMSEAKPASRQPATPFPPPPPPRRPAVAPGLDTQPPDFPLGLGALRARAQSNAAAAQPESHRRPTILPASASLLLESESSAAA